MTRWEVEASSRDAWGNGGTYRVVKVTDDTREEARTRWSGLSCIDAQVIARELNEAHRLGRIEAIETMRAQVFED